MKNLSFINRTRFSKEGAGFTLIEVMVALVIISIAMVTLLATQVQSTRSYADAKVMSICSLLARQKLAELQGSEFPEPGEESGGFENNENYQWTLSLKETDIEGLLEVTLEVSLAPQEEGFEGEPGLPGITVVTYLAKLVEPEEEEGEE